MQLNDNLEHLALEHQAKIEVVLGEKQELIAENRELNKQLSEAEDEIAMLKQQMEEMRNFINRKDSELELEKRRVQ